MSAVVTSGQAAPGTGGSFNYVNSLPINNAGESAIHGNSPPFYATPTGIWSNAGPGDIRLVAHAGMPLPGSSELFFSVDPPVLNSQGRVAFFGYSANSINSLWRENEQFELELVVKQYDPIPGTSNIFIDFTSQTDRLVAMNAKGQIAFHSLLTDENHGVGTLGQGIFALDTNGNLQVIARTGEQIDVDNGPGVDLRTVQSLSFLEFLGYGDECVGNEDGRRSPFNDHGQLAFSASFTDGSDGVFVSNLVASLPGLPGDFDADGDIDGRDFLFWQRNPNVGDLGDWQTNYLVDGLPGDFNGNGAVTGTDFLAWQRGESPTPYSSTDLADWQNNFNGGSLSATKVPESGCLAMFLGAALLVGIDCRRTIAI